MTQRPVVIVGAGPAGLASAAQLGRRGIPAVVLEQADAVAPSWRRRYDRLRLNSSRWFSNLPGARYGRAAGSFPARDEVVRYLEDYAARERIDVRLRTRVERIDRDRDGWIVRTSSGDVATDHVIVASGYDHTPAIPAWPGREGYERPLAHAAAYRNAEPYRDADVLVVGSGCSGMEIAHDIATNGARRVRMAVRTSPNIMLRSPAGPFLGRMVLKLGVERADKVMRVVQNRTVGDLSPYGLPIPEEGMASRLMRLGVAPAIVDKPTIDAIRDGRIEVVAGVERLDATGVVLADGSRIEPDAIVAATGYDTGLAPLVGHLGILGERGVPRRVQGEAAPGLRFIGYIPRPGQMGRMGDEAKVAADGIAAALAPARRKGRRPTAEPSSAMA